MSLSPEAAARHFLDQCEGQVAVACSGGGDSLAALQVLWEIAPRRIWAVTVDHRLREEAAREAADVARFCAERGIPHKTLIWDWQALAGNISALAREARYQLMADWATEQGVSHIVVAQSCEDVAENTLIALGRASGLEGLARMRPAWQHGSVTYHRPFLEVARADLRKALTSRGLTWAEDPSNQNPNYLRSRVRGLLEPLAQAGVPAAHIAESATHLFENAEALSWVLARDFGGTGTIAGEACFAVERYVELPQALRVRLLVGLCRWIAGGYPPRRDELLRLDAALLRTETRRVLGGCIFTRSSKRLRISREFAAVQHWQGKGLFDGRWCLEGSLAEGQTIAPLGPLGFKYLESTSYHNVSRDAAIATPAVWCDRTLVAAPVLGLGEGFAFALKTDLENSLLSH